MAQTALPLTDAIARRAAISDHGRSLIVEAGAGSGKTAVMAGRIAVMLAEGVEPRTIAAVTFTELAASELLFRVRNFVQDLARKRIPPELRVVFPDGLSGPQLRSLTNALYSIDEITCSTIHGFCQRLIRPYPVEANIDPGAAVVDSGEAELLYNDIIDSWLRERLSGEDNGLIVEMVLIDPTKTLELVNRLIRIMREHRTIRTEVPPMLSPIIDEFRERVEAFNGFVKGGVVQEPETQSIAGWFADMAEELPAEVGDNDAIALVKLLASHPKAELCKQDGEFYAYKRKGKWVSAAKVGGFATADGERLNDQATNHYQACCDAWTTMLQTASSNALSSLVQEVRPAVERLHDYRRSAGLMDFNDLIFSARDLLCNYPDVRRALASRYTHVLVDEFQDTDPLQAEVFWRLCGEQPVGGIAENWSKFQIRPGQLFLVGDPKQSIYRFRGADVSAYLAARASFQDHDTESILSISTNFRSCAAILTYVNERFEALFTVEGQPGFTPMDPFHADRDDGPCVASLVVKVADEDGKATAEQRRDGEAEAVAETCFRLIGSKRVRDHKTSETRLCTPGDIALLAPTGTDLWRYEEALERRGIPVSTQAGKNFFRRQEVQDLIAITRALADQRDTLALGALLRGPVVGLTEEELLDIVGALPRSESEPNAIPRLNLSVTPELINHALARDIIEKLQSLRRRSNSTTPYRLICQAVDVLRLRPLLIQRHRGQAERALANVDLYLNLTRAYDVRGLRSLAEAMTASWTDETRAIEGRPDAQEEAVALYTMHAAKGLEWPIVIPVNTMTNVMPADGAIIDRINNTLYCPILGVPPAGYEAALEAEKAELARERIRLWYVTTTRARELLIIPKLDVPARSSSWVKLLDLALDDIPELDLELYFAETLPSNETIQNGQTREIFAEEAKAIVEKERHLVWVTPSRDESAVSPVTQVETPDIAIAAEDGVARILDTVVGVQGGRERGRIIHKLLEEVLMGETDEHVLELTVRGEYLIRELNQPVVDDPSIGLSPVEIAACVSRTLALPEIVSLRPTLTAELPVYASTRLDNVEEATVGIADAVSYDSTGKIEVIIDWKSDVNPTPETIENYGSQVRSYLATTSAERGMIVFVTTGNVVQVSA